MSKPRLALLLSAGRRRGRLLAKAHVGGYTRRTKSGGMVTVQAYETHAPGRQTPTVAMQKQKRDGSNYGHVTPPSDLHPDAAAFVARRPDRPERMAIYHANGALGGSFGQDDDIEAVKGHAERGGFRMDERGHLFRKDAGGGATPAPTPQRTDPHADDIRTISREMKRRARSAEATKYDGAEGMRSGRAPSRKVAERIEEDTASSMADAVHNMAERGTQPGTPHHDLVQHGLEAFGRRGESRGSVDPDGFGEHFKRLFPGH